MKKKIFLKKNLEQIENYWQSHPALFILTLTIFSSTLYFVPLIFKEQKVNNQNSKNLSHRSLPSNSALTPPRGYVLLPLSLKDPLNWTHIVGSHTTLNLYEFKKNTTSLVAQSVKVININYQNPEQPSYFMMIRQSQVPFFLKLQRPLTAALSSPLRKGPQIVKKKRTKKMNTVSWEKYL